MTLGVIGGLVAWLAARDTNPRGARRLFGADIAVQVVLLCAGSALVLTLGTFMRPAVSSLVGATAWPASETGAPVLYYFGTSA